MILFLLLLAVPLIEIALFIVVGDAIGLWPTLGIVVVTAIIGSYALRRQGFATMARLRSLNGPDAASTVLIEGVLLLAAGLLLLTPGVLTDAIGLALLVPAVRRVVAQQIAKHAVTVVARSAAAGPKTEPPDPRAGMSGRGESPHKSAQETARGPARDESPAPRRSPFRRRGRVVEAEDAVVIDARDGGGSDSTPN